MDIRIAKKLAELRKKQGLSEEQLAALLNTDAKRVMAWERGEGCPSQEEIVKLCRIFNVFNLFEGDDINNVNYNNMNDQETQEGTCDFNVFEKIKEHKKIGEAYKLLHFPLWLITVITFMLLGFLGGWWHPGWVVVFFPMTVYPLFGSIIAYKNDHKLGKLLNSLPIPIIATLVFLLLGFLGGWWHPGWLAFLSIPLYYMCVNYVTEVKKYMDNKKK